ncbi:MAG: DUF3467 domain-containing protein [Candidatus Sulfotelmatobacter sp.]
MTDDAKPKIGFVTPEDGIFQAYSNFVDAAWTLFDVTIRFAQIAPTPPGSDHPFDAEENVRVTLAWHQAKNLAKMLTGLVQKFEETNGEIKPLKLTPVPGGETSLPKSDS